MGILGSFPALWLFFCCQGTYVLQDNSFPLLVTMGSGPQYLEEAPKVLGEGRDMPIYPPLLGRSWGWGLASLFSQCSVPHPHPSSWPSPAAFCAAPSIHWASRAWSPPPWHPCPPVSYWGGVVSLKCGVGFGASASLAPHQCWEGEQDYQAVCDMKFEAQRQVT